MSCVNKKKDWETLKIKFSNDVKKKSIVRKTIRHLIRILMKQMQMRRKKLGIFPRSILRLGQVHLTTKK